MMTVASDTFSVTTYLINPKVHITDDVMIYTRAASGFRPGGPNFVLKPGLGNPTFDPDRLWSYELGENRLASYNITDLNLAVDAPHGLEYTLFMCNIFDRAAEVSASVLANEYNPSSPVPVFLAQPRTIGISRELRESWRGMPPAASVLG